MIKKDDYKTIVVFRVFKDLGDVVALFPAEIDFPNGGCSSYQHVGQHGAAHYYHCISITRPAKPSEYKALKRELEGLGYNLKIQKRYTQR